MKLQELSIYCLIKKSILHMSRKRADYISKEIFKIYIKIVFEFMMFVVRNCVRKDNIILQLKNVLFLCCLSFKKNSQTKIL